MAKVRASQIFTREVDDVVAAKKELDDNQGFLAVVEKYSQCPSKNSGGDLGWMPEENLAGLFGIQVTEADKGKIIGPIHSKYGYHILVLTEVQEEITPGKDGPFNASFTMSKVVEMLPETHTLLFKQFQIGMPMMGYQSRETVESFCKDNNKPTQEVLDYLNGEYYTRNVPSIACQDLADKLSSNEPVIILDIREKWEYDIAKIEEATLITADNNAQVLGNLTQDAEVVLVDWKGERGPSFQNWLLQRGFSNIKVLQGGIDEWADKIDPTQGRYEIDEDDGYQYEDIIAEEDFQP